MRFSLLACTPLTCLAIGGVTIAAGSGEAGAHALANDMTCDERRKQES